MSVCNGKILVWKGKENERMKWRNRIVHVPCHLQRPEGSSSPAALTKRSPKTSPWRTWLTEEFTPSRLPASTASTQTTSMSEPFVSTPRIDPTLSREYMYVCRLNLNLIETPVDEQPPNAEHSDHEYKCHNRVAPGVFSSQRSPGQYGRYMYCATAIQQMFALLCCAVL